MLQIPFWWAVATVVVAMAGGAVLYHFYATKVLGYVKEAQQVVKGKL